MLVLKYHSTTAIPIEADVVTPENFADKTVAEIACLPVQHGNREVPLGEFFHVEGSAADRDILIEGNCSRVKWLGTGMKTGRITVHGSVGMHLGAEMAGGEIHVHGNAGDWAGAEMRGGRIHVHGDAGHLVGAAYRGSRRGMRGGAILVDGKAGDEVGATMRRGLIAVGGAIGDFAGMSMIAGTLLLFGEQGARAGAGMKRGTIALFRDGPQPLPSFRFDCLFRPVYLQLFLRRLSSWGFVVRPEHFTDSYQRYSGDLVALGKGELLYWQAT